MFVNPSIPAAVLLHSCTHRFRACMGWHPQLAACAGKLKGPKWEGTRAEFADDPTEDTEAAQGTGLPDAKGGASDTSSASTEQVSMRSSSPAAPPAVGLKWKKLTAAALQQVGFCF